jgi:GINS complex subunit 1
MNRREVDYFYGFSRLLTDYIEASGVDVTSDTLPPKRGHLISVRALRDCGELVTSRGPVKVAKDQLHIMWRQDAEALILRGWLEEVHTAV